MDSLFFGSLSRRGFVRQGAGLFAVAASPWSVGLGAASNRVRIGVMGVNGRGMAHIEGFMAAEGAQIAAVCDVDSRALGRARAAVEKRQGSGVKAVGDFRRMLEDPEIDAISIAAPNHWHAPATILACAAGKDVYVEKPGSHTAQEAGWMVEAARKHRRVVQMGNQRRSWPWVRQAIDELHGGIIGEVHFARTWYNAQRPSIGKGRRIPPPDWLDYGLWQGPAPERPYLDNLVHYHWHWRWHWGGGELANNGIHALDVARWGLKVGLPGKVACTGGRYRYQDDQETPDVYVASYDFGTKGMTWESHSCDPRGFEGEGFGIHFYGAGGSMLLMGAVARVHDLKQALVKEIKGSWNDRAHFANFVECVRSRATPTSDIATGQQSTMLCHLGNIAVRTGETLHLDPTSGRVKGSRAAEKLWGREYRKGWTPRV